MTRPKPRTSSLAGESPVAPPAEHRPPTTRQPAPAPSPTPAEQPSERRYPPKVSFYQDRDDSARMRAAMLHTQGLEGHRSLSDFINRAVMAEVERLETKHNNGQPWPAVGPGQGPTGRPVGS